MSAVNILPVSLNNLAQTGNNQPKDSRLCDIFKSYVKAMVYGLGSLALSARFAHRYIEKKSGMVTKFNPIGIITLVGAISIAIAIRSVYQLVKYCKELQAELKEAKKNIDNLTFEYNDRIADYMGADTIYAKDQEDWNNQIKILESQIQALKEKDVEHGKEKMTPTQEEISNLNEQLEQKNKEINDLNHQLNELRTAKETSFQESLRKSILIQPSSLQSFEKEQGQNSNFDDVGSFLVVKNEDSDESLSESKLKPQSETYFNQAANFGLGLAMNIGNTVLNQFGIAQEGFTTNAPSYKEKQLTQMLISLTDGVASDLNKIDSESGLENGTCKDTYVYIKTKLEGKFGKDNQSINELLNILKPIFDTTYNKTKGGIRYEFLMGIEKLMENKDFCYEKEISGFISESNIETRLNNYPHIVFLHLIAKHLTTSPIWNVANEVLQSKIEHHNKPEESQTLANLLKKDVERLKQLEPNEMDLGGVTAEKVGMQNGNSEATNYRYNYSSLLGSLTFNNRGVNWLRMGTPSIDIGGVYKPTQLSALYTLYLDHCAANKEKIAYFGFQKGPKCVDSKYDGFESGDYEKNRTAAFIEATKEPRWKDAFTFMNFSLDQIVTVEALKLKNSENDITSIDNFSLILKKLMVKGEAGFFGMEEEIVTSSMEKVKKAFFVKENLNQTERWNFVILTYAMVILNTVGEKAINTFHANCKDGIDRAAIINLAILMISQFSDQCAENRDQTKIQQNIEQCRTMFSHAALLVKGQAVIKSRAPFAYGIAQQLELAAAQSNKADRAAVVASMVKDFKPHVKNLK